MMKKFMTLLTLVTIIGMIAGCGKTTEDAGGAITLTGADALEEQLVSEIMELPTEVIDEPVEEAEQEWEEHGEAYLALLGQQSASHSEIPGVSTMFVLQTSEGYVPDLSKTTFKGVEYGEGEAGNISIESYTLDMQTDDNMNGWWLYLLRVTTQGEDYLPEDLVFTTTFEDSGTTYYTKSVVVDADDIVLDECYATEYGLMRINGHYYVIDNNIDVGPVGTDFGVSVLTRDRVVFVSDGGSLDELFQELADKCGFSEEPWDTPYEIDASSLEFRYNEGEPELWYTYEIYGEDDNYENRPYIVYMTENVCYAIKMF